MESKIKQKLLLISQKNQLNKLSAIFSDKGYQLHKQAINRTEPKGISIPDVIDAGIILIPDQSEESLQHYFGAFTNTEQPIIYIQQRGVQHFLKGALIHIEQGNKLYTINNSNGAKAAQKSGLAPILDIIMQYVQPENSNTLSLFFDTQEYTEQEMAHMISWLSDVYHEVTEGQDTLEIKSSSVLSLSESNSLVTA